MIDQRLVAERIGAYLNGDIDLGALVSWAEDALVALSDAKEDIPDEQELLLVLGYIGAGDSVDFPLTWEVLNDFLARLRARVSVTVTAA